MADDNNTSKQRPLLTGPKGKPGDPMKKKPKFNIMWVYAIIVLGIFAIATFNKGSKPKEIDLKQFREEMLKTGDVEKLVVVNNETVEIFIKADRLSNPKYQKMFTSPLGSISERGPQFFFRISSIEIFDKNLEKINAELPAEMRIEYSTVKRTDVLMQVLSWVIPFGLLIAFYLFIFRRMSNAGGGGGAGSIFSVGKSKAKIFNK